MNFGEPVQFEVSVLLADRIGILWYSIIALLSDQSHFSSYLWHQHGIFTQRTATHWTVFSFLDHPLQTLDTFLLLRFLKDILVKF